MAYTKRMNAQRQRQSGRNTKWSESMSPEAQIAMQLAIEDTRAMKMASDDSRDRQMARDLHTHNSISSEGKSHTRVAFRNESPNTDDDTNSERSHQPTYTRLYETNCSARMRRDVTDDSYNEERETKRALGGGKIESAMEIIEFVKHDAGDDTSLDDKAIDELAKINSVDKCVVWIEATQKHHKRQLPNIPEVDFEPRDTDS